MLFIEDWTLNKILAGKEKKQETFRQSFIKLPTNLN